MSLQGSLDTMPVLDLMAWLSGRRPTGVLKFKRGSVSKMITIMTGQITNAGSTDPREYFGQFLINFGLITEQQLQKAFETQQETRVLLGRILVMTGLVSEEQILKMLELKIRETFLDLFLWDNGFFEFYDGVVPEEPSVVHTAVELLKLVHEGVTRRNHYAEIRKVIPNNSCRLVCNSPAIPPNLEPHSTDGAMVQMASQGFSVEDIILRFHSVDFPVLRSIHDRIRRGWFTVAPPATVATTTTVPAPSTSATPAEIDIPEPEINVEVDVEPAEQPGPDRYLFHTEAALRKKDFRLAAAILQKGLRAFPNDRDLADSLESIEKTLTDSLRLALLANNRVPYLVSSDILQTGANWTPIQRYLLSRIDGQQDLRSIIMVSPLKELEALKTIHALLQAGVVGLR